MQEFYKIYNRMYSRYCRMDAWNSGRETNKLTKEQFKAWITEASKARQQYKAGKITGEEMLRCVSKQAE